MLGRLRMSVADCITAYLSLSERVFRKIRHRVTIKGKLQGRFDSEELAQAVREVIKQQGLQEDALRKDDPEANCKVYVNYVLQPRAADYGFVVKYKLIIADLCAQ
jgi:thiaminase